VRVRGSAEEQPDEVRRPLLRGGARCSGSGAEGPNLIAEEVPPESPEPVAGLPAVRSLGSLLEVELAERRRRMLEEAVLELERLHLERLKQLLAGGGAPNLGFQVGARVARGAQSLGATAPRRLPSGEVSGGEGGST